MTTITNVPKGANASATPMVGATCHTVTSHEHTVEREVQDLRAMLLGSTSLPHLGMTIAEASRKTADLLAEHDGSGPLTDEQADAFAAQWSMLENTVIAAVPSTILDAASILDRVFPDDATHIPQRDIPAVRRVAAFLHQVAETAWIACPVETSIIPSIGMSFREAADRVHSMVERANNSPRGEDDGIEDKAELERREAARTADCQEWCLIEDAMMATPAQTIGDLFAKLERIACPSLGIRNMVFSDAEIVILEKDVKRLRPLLAGPDLSVPEDGGEAPQDALTGLYERWEAVHARFLAEGLPEEEHEAAEAELDQIEDRLEGEPVRHLGDAIVKLGYFLKKSHQVLDDELLPSIDENSSRPWPRLLFLIEDGAEQLAADIREPFRAMVAGLRQLMQRHVKLAEEAERRAGAYQLPEQVSQAMQAVYARNRAASAEEDARKPEQAHEQREEVLNLLHALEPGNRKRYLSFMRFLAVSSLLHGAMLDFAHEHGMDTEYRQWLERHLADLVSEQGNAVANDRHQDSDTFADTVAAFEAEAPATLALPLEPTGRMVDAGASAAGITPAQFQAAYAAAVEALKLERAA